jgi:hypothetical protein
MLFSFRTGHPMRHTPTMLAKIELNASPNPRLTLPQEETTSESNEIMSRAFTKLLMRHCKLRPI